MMKHWPIVSLKITFYSEVLFIQCYFPCFSKTAFSNVLRKHHATYPGFICSTFFYETASKVLLFIKFSQNLPTCIPSPFDLQHLFGLFTTSLSTIALIPLTAYYLTLILHRLFTLCFSCLCFLTKVF